MKYNLLTASIVSALTLTLGACGSGGGSNGSGGDGADNSNGSSIAPKELDLVLFNADDQATPGSNNSSLWVTDGTEAGTRRLSEDHTLSGLKTVKTAGKIIFRAKNKNDSAIYWAMTDGNSIDYVTLNGAKVKPAKLPATGSPDDTELYNAPVRYKGQFYVMTSANQLVAFGNNGVASVKATIRNNGQCGIPTNRASNGPMHSRNDHAYSALSVVGDNLYLPIGYRIVDNGRPGPFRQQLFKYDPSASDPCKFSPAKQTGNNNSLNNIINDDTLMRAIDAKGSNHRFAIMGVNPSVTMMLHNDDGTFTRADSDRVMAWLPLGDGKWVRVTEDSQHIFSGEITPYSKQIQKNYLPLNTNTMPSGSYLDVALRKPHTIPKTTDPRRCLGVFTFKDSLYMRYNDVNPVRGGGSRSLGGPSTHDTVSATAVSNLVQINNGHVSYVNYGENRGALTDLNTDQNVSGHGGKFTHFCAHEAHTQWFKHDSIRLVIASEQKVTPNATYRYAHLWALNTDDNGNTTFDALTPDLSQSIPVVIGALNGGKKLIFEFKDDTHGYELWITDGTRSGTKLLKDITPGNTSGMCHIENGWCRSANEAQ